MTFTDAISDAEYRTGEIRIHGAEGFEGMRKAGRLAAECRHAWGAALRQTEKYPYPGLRTTLPV